jgi:hypothetical protein
MGYQRWPASLHVDTEVLWPGLLPQMLLGCLGQGLEQLGSARGGGISVGKSGGAAEAVMVAAAASWSGITSCDDLWSC